MGGIARSKATIVLLHVAVWLILLLSPLMYFDHDSEFSIQRMLTFSVSPLMLVLVFYLNYLWLTPKFFANGKRSTHIIINIALIIVLGIALNRWMELSRSLFEPAVAGMGPPPNGIRGPGPGPEMEPHKNVLNSILFMLRDMFNMALAALIATATCLATRWQQTENARREAEQEKTVAELKNLRSQINPHFLLNTLNNIYALTAIDTARAQKAIEQLSRLLRHVLYDYDGQFTELTKETDFLNDYINLMRIRLSGNVDVKYTTEIPDGCKAMIAPLIFISLVENAFKHGVSTTEYSWIKIDIKADNQYITCEIANSNHPKSQNDRSGHGIGLRQVARRLELTYPNRYTWEKGISSDGKEYYSIIKLNYKTDLYYGNNDS